MRIILFAVLSIALTFSACKTQKKAAPVTETEASRRAKLIGDMLDRLATSLIEAANKQAEVIRTAEGVHITFQPDFYFESSTATLSPTANDVLGRVANVLNQYPYTELFIEGHADSTGYESFNKRLSQLRAKQVAVFLRDNGVRANRLALAGYGSARPIATNETPEGRQRNRRVLVKIRAKEDEFLATLLETKQP